MVLVDRGWLAELLARFAEAIGAVERGNVRAGAVKQERACTAGWFKTGAAPAGCPTP